MANYITISRVATECEGCGRQLTPGVIGLTDEIHGPDHRLDPQCPDCFGSLDADLVEFWITGDRAVAERACDLLADALKRCEGRDGCALRERLLDDG